MVSEFPGPPQFREPHPVRPAGVLGGTVATAIWFAALLVLQLPTWWLVAASVASVAAGTAVCWLLLQRGDRGVAAGAALALAVVVCLLARAAIWAWLDW